MHCHTWFILVTLFLNRLELKNSLQLSKLSSIFTVWIAAIMFFPFQFPFFPFFLNSFQTFQPGYYLRLLYTWYFSNRPQSAFSLCQRQSLHFHCQVYTDSHTQVMADSNNSDPSTSIISTAAKTAMQHDLCLTRTLMIHLHVYMKRKKLPNFGLGNLGIYTLYL